MDLAVSSGVASDEEAALALARERIASGAAAERFEADAPGGAGEALPEAPDVHELKARRRDRPSASVTCARWDSRCAPKLGGGRSAPSERSNPPSASGGSGQQANASMRVTSCAVSIIAAAAAREAALERLDAARAWIVARAAEPPLRRTHRGPGGWHN